MSTTTSITIPEEGAITAIPIRKIRNISTPPVEANVKTQQTSFGALYSMKIEYPFTGNVLPHQLNLKLYGKEKPSAELIESVRMLGILQPLIVDKQRRVLSGHRRLLAAEQLKLEQVPVLYFKGTDLEAEQLIIESNRQRVKTPEQIGREFIELKRIEAELAKQRQGTRTDIVEIVPPSSTGKARDIAANQLGISGRTGDKLEAIIDAADSGDQQARTALDDLNAKKTSVSAAHKSISNRARRREAFVTEHPEYQGRSNKDIDSEIHRAGFVLPPTAPEEPTQEELEKPLRLLFKQVDHLLPVCGDLGESFDYAVAAMGAENPDGNTHAFTVKVDDALEAVAKCPTFKVKYQTTWRTSQPEETREYTAEDLATVCERASAYLAYVAKRIRAASNVVAQPEPAEMSDGVAS